MLNPHARLARTRLWALAVAAILVVSGLGASPASAAPGAPGGLSPAYTAVNATPVLQWDRVAGATSYRVEVDDSSDFASQLYSTTTVNRRVVPSRQLPVGEIYWRVRAIDGTGSSDWASASFSRSGIAGPTLVSPANGAVLVQPTDPALLSWTPVAGADGYTVEVDDAADFIGTTTYTTKTSSIVIPEPADQDDLLLAGDREPRLRDQLGEVRRPHLLDRGPGQAGARRPDAERSDHQRRGRRAGVAAGAGREVLRAPGQHRPGLHQLQRRRRQAERQGHPLVAAGHAEQRPVLLAGPPGRRPGQQAGLDPDGHLAVPPALARPARPAVPGR